MPTQIPTLPAPSFEALAKAALLVDPFIIQALLASGTEPLALDPLFDNEILEELENGEACLANPDSREEILSRLSWSAKRQLSLTLAKTYLSLNAKPAEIAQLYLKAQQHAEARAQFLEAAQIDCKANDYRSALDSLRSAFEIWPIDEEIDQRKNALAEMARCASNCLDHQATSLALEELLEMARQESSLKEQVELNQRLAQLATARGDHLQARERLAAGAAIAEDAGFLKQANSLRRRLAQAQGDSLHLRDALDTLQIVREASLTSQDWSLLSDTLAYAAMLTAMLGSIKEANTLLNEALTLAIDKDLPDQITTAYRRQANINEYASNYEAYRDSELAALDRCRTLDQKEGTQACLTCVSYAFFRLGQYEQSLSAIEEAVETLHAEGELFAGAICIRHCIHALQTNNQDIHPQLDEALRFNRLHGGRVFEFYVLWAMGANAVLTNQTKRAFEAFEQLSSFWKETDDHKDVAPGLLCAASFYASENRASQLALCIDIFNTISRRSESPEPHYGLLAATAEDAWLHGKTDLAITRFQQAIKGYQSMSLPFEQAWTLWRLAFVQAQAGESAEALLAWKQAEEIAKRHSLRPLSRNISRDRRLHQTNKSEATALTARQIEVARLIAAGHSNKEAADHLKISPRTVEMHVASLIERLGCRTRTEAASKASQLGMI